MAADELSEPEIYVKDTFEKYAFLHRSMDPSQLRYCGASKRRSLDQNGTREKLVSCM